MRAMQNMTKIGCLLMASAALLVTGQCFGSGYVYQHVAGFRPWGVEIGNGKKLIFNLDGEYLFSVPRSWDVDFPEASQFEKFTEVIAPSSEGTPRTRLRVNVLHDPNIVSYEQLLAATTATVNARPRDSRDEERELIAPANYGNYQGVEILSNRNGIQEVEVSLFRKSGEIIQVTFDGKPGPKDKPSSFDKVAEVLRTLKARGESANN